MPWEEKSTLFLRPERSRDPILTDRQTSGRVTGAMAQSLSKIYVHLIFSTKHRERTLPKKVRPDLHAYIGGSIQGFGLFPDRNQ